MALQTCRECGKELSSEALTCPHCGAPRKKKRSVIKRVGIGVLGLITLLVVIGVVGNNDSSNASGSSSNTTDSDSSVFPACTSSDAAQNFKNTFNGSQYARSLNLTAIDVTDQKKISESADGKKLVCQATLMLNNAEKATYTFTFTPASGGQFYIEGEPAGD